MSVNTIRKSNEDNLIAGTIAMYRDNENKLKIINDLQSFLDSLSTIPMNENDVVALIKSCKNHLSTSHAVVRDNLSKVNRGAKAVVESLRRIKCDECITTSSNNDNDKINLKNNVPPSSDNKEVAEIMLAMNKSNTDGLKTTPPGLSVT